MGRAASRRRNIIPADLHVKLNKIKQCCCASSLLVILSRANLARQIFRLHSRIVKQPVQFSRARARVYVPAAKSSRTGWRLSLMPLTLLTKPDRRASVSAYAYVDYPGKERERGRMGRESLLVLLRDIKITWTRCLHIKFSSPHAILFARHRLFDFRLWVLFMLLC